MIKEYRGNVFNAGADCIVNTVNIEGFMGAGLAYEVKLRYPGVFKAYEEACKKRTVDIGKLEIYREDDLYILNFPTKTYWRLDSQYVFIEKGLEAFLKDYDLLIRSNNIRSIAFPKLGAGKGGLEWKKVRELMYRYLSKLDENIDIYICLDELDYAEGVEKSMLDLFNSLDESQLRDNLKLSTRQVDNVVGARPIERVFEIREINGIGKKSYENIHRYLYESSTVELGGETARQLNFFDF